MNDMKQGTPNRPKEITSFFVPGTPRPGGSKTGFFNKKLGRVMMTDACKTVRPWMAAVADAAMQAYDGPVLEKVPINLDLVFMLSRPGGHYGTGRNAGSLKKSAPPYPVTRPDALKLARAVEDALSGVIYRDDASIVSETISKLYALPGGREGVYVAVSEAGAAATPPPQELPTLFQETDHGEKGSEEEEIGQGEEGRAVCDPRL